MIDVLPILRNSIRVAGSAYRCFELRKKLKQFALFVYPIIALLRGQIKVAIISWTEFFFMFSFFIDFIISVVKIINSAL